MRKVLSLTMFVFCTAIVMAQDPSDAPLTYYTGNPAISIYETGRDFQGNVFVNKSYTAFVSGRIVANATRWTAAAFNVPASSTLSFDTISIALDAPNNPPFQIPPERVYVIVVPALETGEPDLSNPLAQTDLPLSTAMAFDTPFRDHYGNNITIPRMMLSNISLGTRLTLEPGNYFLIVYGDTPDAGAVDRYVDLRMGAPGGPNFYHSYRRRADGSWEMSRFSGGTFPTSRLLNPCMPVRANDPNGANGVDPDSREGAKTYHSPWLYHPVFGFRDSQAAGANVTGSAAFENWTPADLTLVDTIEVILYKPGTNHRVVRFSMPKSSALSRAINVSNVQAGTYDIVVRPVKENLTLQTDENTPPAITGYSCAPMRWLGVRLSSQSVNGTLNIQVSLPNGDVNGDGMVDDSDLLGVLFDFGNSGGIADLNGDGTVDDSDLLIVLFNFGLIGELGLED